MAAITERAGAAVGRSELRRALRRRRSRIDVWDAVDDALNPAFAKPRCVDDLEVSTFVRRDGEQYAMLRASRGPNYMRLSSSELDTARLMDGSRTVSEIVVSRFQTSGEFELSSVANLVDEMREGGFLTEQPVSVYDAVRAARKRAKRFPRLRRLLGERRVETTRAHTFFAAMYRMGGRLAFTRAGAVIGVSVLAAGIVAFLALIAKGKYSLIGDSAAGGVAVLYAVDLASTFVHESGHALAVVHAGRRVNAAGMLLYLGMPAFYIDTTDMWMAPRRQRIVSTIAGPYAEWVLAGAASIIALALPPSPITGLLYKYAVLSYITILQNLIPFLRLDGYYTLMDLLEVINLRERAFDFVRHELPGKLRRRARLTRAEAGLTAYGILGVVFVVLAAVLSALFWGRIFSHAISRAFRAGWISSILVVGLLALLMAPVLRAAIVAGRTTLRAARRALPVVRRIAKRRMREEAIAMITALPLAAPLDEEAIAEVAEAVEQRRLRAGASVIRQGERGFEFFVVRSGVLEVARVDDDGVERVLRRLERGSAFGELALLEDAARSATVRAVTGAEVFVLRKAAFDRALAPRMEVNDQFRSQLVSAAEIRSLGPFRSMGVAQATALLSGARWELYGAGHRIVTQGHPGDSFFVIGSGRADVIENRHVIASLGPGDYFGERSLLLDVPRTATVRAATPVRVLEIDRDAFNGILAKSFRRSTLLLG